jgi:maltokinase
VFDRTARSRRMGRRDGIAGKGSMTGKGGTAGKGDVADMLATWLPHQRWFPGRGTSLSELAIVSDVTLRTGDPALRHLIVETVLHGEPARFQVLVGYRSDLPEELADAIIGRQDGVACYDALHDPELADVLLRGITEQRLAEHLRFVREPAAPQLPAYRPDAPGRTAGRLLGAEQSNTSLVFGDQAILKVLRRLFPGANPDLEVADGLARLGSAHVAAPFGWIETDLDGEPVLLAVLSQFLSGASDGWTLALAALHRLYARYGAVGQDNLTERVTADDHEGNGSAPFTTQAGLLGQATAELHADMARAFGSRAMTAAELAGLAAAMHGKLSDAIAVLPALRDHEARIRSAYDAVADFDRPVPVQRIHGDYHLGQVLRASQGWVALDFEGEPAVPLAVRRALAPALRDVAGMLRSFDYAARHQLIGRPADDPVAAVAAAWVRQCQDAFCASYAAGGGTDPDSHATLLRALTLEKAVYEVIYEYRHRPSWLPIPLGYLAAA